MRAHSVLAFLHCAAVVAGAVIDRRDDDFDTFINAIGIGVQDLKRSTNFYKKALNWAMVLNMPLDDWDEDILANPNGGSALVTMKWNDDRPTDNLPFKLQFACKDPEKAKAAVISAGGKDDTLKTEANPGAIYARDPDGYLLEFITTDKSPMKLKKAFNGCAMSSVGVGVNDIEKAAAFWSKSLKLPASPMKQYKEWSSISFSPEDNSEFLLMNWNESPKRNTNKLPYKIVIGTTDSKAFAKVIKAEGAVLTLDPADGEMAGLGFAKDPMDNNLIEINGTGEGGVFH